MCNLKPNVVSLHNHTDYSNIRLLDAINRVEDLVDTAVKLGHKGIAITDHESLSAHHKAIEYVNKGKEEGIIPKDFKLILGNEIYLVEDAKWCQENYSNKEVEVKFYHYLLIAKNKEGHKALRKLSSRAWENSFRTGLMERVPTEEWYLEQIVKEHPNTLVATSACLGGRIPQEILRAFEQMQLANVAKGKDNLPTKKEVQMNPRAFPHYTRNLVLNNEKPDYNKHVELAKFHLQQAREYIEWNISLFGKEDFYLELQPATYPEQILVNKQLVKFAREYGLKTVITFDAHYARPEEAPIHEAFLNAKEGDREVADFYAHTYIHTVEEVNDKMEYFEQDIINESLNNTIEVANKVEDYVLTQETIIPKIDVPKFEVQHIFKKWYDKYEYIHKMATSKEEQDRYLMFLIEEGFLELVPFRTFTPEKFHLYLDRINKEVGELWNLSQKMSQAVSSYYVTTARLVDIIWADDECGDSFDVGSLVGFGRGSAVAFLINYLMKITMVNPLEYGLEIPHWRLA